MTNLAPKFMNALLDVIIIQGADPYSFNIPDYEDDNV